MEKCARGWKDANKGCMNDQVDIADHWDSILSGTSGRDCRAKCLRMILLEE